MGMALFYYYFAGVSLGLNLLAIAVFVVSVVVATSCFIDTSVNGGNWAKIIKRAFIALVISSCILVFVPRYTFFYALAGYEASKHIATTELGTKVQDILIKKLEEFGNDKK